MAKLRKKKTAFVPSVVFGTVVAGVIPACVAASGGGTTVSPADASSDAPNDSFLTADVADTCFGSNQTCPPCCGVAAVAYMAFDSGDANDADGPTDAPPQWGGDVADVGFADVDGGDGGDGSHGGFGVADVGFRGD